MFRYTTYYADYNNYIIEFKMAAKMTVNDMICKMIEKGYYNY